MITEQVLMAIVEADIYKFKFLTIIFNIQKQKLGAIESLRISSKGQKVGNMKPKHKKYASSMHR